MKSGGIGLAYAASIELYIFEYSILCRHFEIYGRRTYWKKS